MEQIFCGCHHHEMCHCDCTTMKQLATNWLEPSRLSLECFSRSTILTLVSHTLSCIRRLSFFVRVILSCLWVASCLSERPLISIIESSQTPQLWHKQIPTVWVEPSRKNLEGYQVFEFCIFVSLKLQFLVPVFAVIILIDPPLLKCKIMLRRLPHIHKMCPYLRCNCIKMNSWQPIEWNHPDWAWNALQGQQIWYWWVTPYHAYIVFPSLFVLFCHACELHDVCQSDL